ncbi:FAD-dependent oxidoreductase [Nocardioides sp. B-3]|uniref:FAD-dependent oxidoreductase n=1 Tax=Nocardioides sp. B-3 TaxID=2895565 RepID=UPI002152018C|nr:FAD-dependent oxidoreductase [Nocardioides sp. B-3]UUZ59269.1 FAD-dependent oxidoreductase [Nocardioides sp. B-3]
MARTSGSCARPPGAEALDLLERLSLRNQPVALIAADQRMPMMTGIEMLAGARVHAASAKFLLLTAYADTEVAIRAINDIGLDYYLLKPRDPPEDRLYPVIDDLLADWRAENPESTVAVRVVGHRWSEGAHELRQFLTRNHVPYKWLDVEVDPEGERLRSAAGVDPSDLPLVLVPDSDPLVSPHPLDVARALGLRTTAQQQVYDVCIVGAGPAGLAAAVYAASEGLSTVIVEREAAGGQAGQSAAIENYLGFPRGLSGADLTHRALAQVTRFGAELVLAREVTGLETRGPARAVLYEEAGETAAIEARSVIVATGVSYRRLAADGVDALTGRGVYYGADATEAAQCNGDDVYLVGAANSAGRAALNLAKHAKRVVLLVRGPSIEATMSQYLVDRITSAPTIEVRTSSEVAAVGGAGHLECLTIADRITGAVEVVYASWLFVFIGAEPRTDWLGEAVRRDGHGFVVTGPDVREGWPLERAPYSLETSVPGGLRRR